MHCGKFGKYETKMNKFLRNKYSKETLLKQRNSETEERKTISFYRYALIPEPQLLRDQLYEEWSSLGLLGRIYLAKEGINAQVSLPISQWNNLKNSLNRIPGFANLKFNEALEDSALSFLKLTIKVRKKIVADGLNEEEFSPFQVGRHLTPEEFHEAIQRPNAKIIDFRNNYESEVGRFRGAICPDAETFREELIVVEEILKEEPKDSELYLYCTGGIRCEKASAYLIQKGFTKVHQLEGGIVSYTNYIRNTGLESMFRGKNFVFDGRLGERVTEDILSECYNCGKICDTHTNCANVGCHVLFIQCEECTNELQGNCSDDCQKINQLSLEKQKELRKNIHSKYPTHHLSLKHKELIRK